MNKLQEVNNLATVNQSDFTITAEGEAFISQRKLANLLGINRSALSMHLSTVHPNANTSKGLSDILLQTLTTYYAYECKKPSQKAKDFLKLLLQAGAKAFIFNQAGYKANMEAPSKELSALELAKIQVKLLEDIEAKNILIDKTNKTMMFVRGKLGGTTKEKNRLQLALGVSDKFIPIAIMKRRFPELQFTPNALTKMAKRLGEEIERTKPLHTASTVNQYSYKTWLGAYPELHDILGTA